MAKLKTSLGGILTVFTLQQARDWFRDNEVVVPAWAPEDQVDPRTKLVCWHQGRCRMVKTQQEAEEFYQIDWSKINLE